METMIKCDGLVSNNGVGGNSYVLTNYLTESQANRREQGGVGTDYTHNSLKIVLTT